MAGAWTTVSVKDSGGTARTMRAWDESGTGAGPFSFASTIGDLTGAGSVVIKAASTAAAAADESLVTNESPNSQLSTVAGATADAAVAAGATGSLSAKLRSISRDLVANIVLAAGANVIGAVTQSGSWVLAAGSALIGKVQVGDGTNNLSLLAASSGPPAATVVALPVSLRDVNPNGSALQANSAPVTVAPTSFRVAVTPTVTASAYTAGNVLGGIMTFASILLGSPNSSPTKWSGVLESISVKFKATAVTGEIDVAVFTASPSGGTYTDKTAPTFNTADAAKLVGIYALATPESTLGTMTVYNLDGIGAVIDGASTSLFVVMTVKGTPTPASTSDVIVELGVLQG